MNRQLDVKIMEKWRERNGPKEAIRIVMETLFCSKSKAQKIVWCRYPSVPQPLEQIALAGRIGVSWDMLYPAVGKPRAKKAS